MSIFIRVCLTLAVTFTALNCRADDLLITISPETTRITSPLKGDGYPDYVAALNSQFQKNTTPENNLAVAIWKITGPVQLSPDFRPHFFHAIGMDDLPTEGDYMVDFFSYYKKHLASSKGAAELAAGQHKIDSNRAEDLYVEVSEAPWTEASHPEVFQWREDNKDHIEACVNVAHSKKQYYNPYVLAPGEREDAAEEFAPELISILLPGVHHMREIARTVAIDANYHLGNGDIDSAMRNAIALHRIGRLTARGGTLIEGLVGIAISGIASSLDQKILNANNLTREQLQAHRSNLRKLPPMPKMIDKINLTERYMYLDTTISVAKYGPSSLNSNWTGSAARPNPILKGLGKLVSSSLVNWDSVMRRGNYWYDELYRTGSIQDVHERTKAYAELETRLETLVTEARDPASLAKKVLFSGKTLTELTSEQMSNILISLLLPASEAALSVEDRALMQNEITQIGIALELHYLEHENYPSNLKALVGPNLKTIPQDRFNENGLTYRTTPNGYLLYSFGRDREDNQGNTSEDQPTGDDIALKRER
ncbi:MAG: hypothetical protein VW875_10175 [Planctomycetaceae bacterium]